ncbi:unnamed protein product [Urochloa humidicola]
MAADSDPHRPLWTQAAQATRGQRPPATESSDARATDSWGHARGPSSSAGAWGPGPSGTGRDGTPAHRRVAATHGRKPRPRQRIGIPCGARGASPASATRTFRDPSGLPPHALRPARRSYVGGGAEDPAPGGGRRCCRARPRDGGRSESGDVLGRVGGVVRLRPRRTPHYHGSPNLAFVYRLSFFRAYGVPTRGASMTLRVGSFVPCALAGERSFGLEVGTFRIL